MKRILATILLLAATAFGQIHTLPTKDGNNVFTGNDQFAKGAQVGPVTFAHLSSPVYVNQSNGTIVWVTDAVAQNTCAGSGTGAFAFRVNSLWSCAVAGGGGGGSGTVNTGTLNHLAKNVFPATVDDSSVIDNGTTVSTAEPFSASTLTSTVATGTAPLTVTSTTVVANLNVSQLLGQTWAIPGTIGGTTPGAATFTNLTITGTCTGCLTGAVKLDPGIDQTLISGALIQSLGQIIEATNTTGTPSNGFIYMGVNGIGQGTLAGGGAVSAELHFNPATGAIVLDPPSSTADDGGHGVVINNAGLYIAGHWTDLNGLIIASGNAQIAGGGPNGSPVLSLGSTGVAGVLFAFPSAGGGSYTITPQNTSATVNINWPSLSGTLALTNSPAFTGTPTAPTAICGTNTTQLATTAFVVGCGGGGGGAVSSVFGRTGAVVATSGDYTAAQVTNAVSLAPSAIQTIQGTSAAVIDLSIKCPAGAAGSLACLQVLDSSGANVVSFLQNDTTQFGTGVGGQITLTDIVGPNANPATAGQVRVSNTDQAVCWRDNANTTNYCLAKTSADIITSDLAVALKETVAGSGIAGYGVLYEDSSTHVPSWSANNGSFLVIPRETGAMTSGHLVSVNATTNLIADSGVVAANVLTGTATNHGVALGGAAQALSFTAAGTAGQCLISNGAAADPTYQACGGGASTALSAITAGAGANSINSGDNAQVWNWQLTTASKTAFKFTENAASTSTGTPVLLAVSTIATSTLNPFQMDSNGNGLRMDTTGKLAKIGTGALDVNSLSSVTGSGAAVLATSATSVTLDAEGSSNVLTRPFYVEFTPICSNTLGSYGAFDNPTSASATVTCFGTTTTQAVLDFPISVTTTNTGHFTLPQGWVGNLDARVYWFANAASSNAIRWSIQTGCVADSESVSTGPSYNSASQTNSAYTGTANQRKTTTLSAVTVTNCAAGETLYFKVARIGGDAGDTLGATAELLGVQFEGRFTK